MFRFSQESLALKAAQPLLRSVKSGRALHAVHSLSDVYNERNSVALHKAEIAVPSHKAAEIE